MPETPSPDPAARGAIDQGPLEARLRAAREARGLSLTDVQQETRIPADVLQRLEDGRLLGDASFNPVYLKALLKAYAAAVGLSPDEVVTAFDPGSHRLVADPPHAVAMGTSPPPPPDPVAEATPARPRVARAGANAPENSARAESPGEPAASSPPPPAAAPPAAATPGPEPAAAPAVAAPEPAAAARRPSAPAAPAKASGERAAAASTTPAAPAAEPGKDDAPTTTKSAAPAVAAVAASPVAALESRTAGPEATAPVGKRRVMTAEEARAPRAFGRSWPLMIGGTLGIAAVIGLMLFVLFRDRTPAPEPRPRPVAADTAAAPDTTTAAAEPPPAAAQGPRMSTPVRVTVTAGDDGLQNFRVTAEPNERLGHWIEAGASMTFESPTAVVLWGEGAEGLDGEATLELQGLRWTPADGQVLRIDAQNGQRLLDSLSANG